MFKRASIIGGALVLALGVGAGCNKSSGSNDKGERTVAADNTAVNQQAHQETTAENAGMGKSDVDIMASIRKRVVDDGALSSNAHNVKIVAQDGTVTLKGPVASAIEKATIEDYAVDVVGAKNVVNEIEIAP